MREKVLIAIILIQFLCAEVFGQCKYMKLNQSKQSFAHLHTQVFGTIRNKQDKKANPFSKVVIWNCSTNMDVL